MRGVLVVQPRERWPTRPTRLRARRLASRCSPSTATQPCGSRSPIRRRPSLPTSQLPAARRLVRARHARQPADRPSTRAGRTERWRCRRLRTTARRTTASGCSASCVRAGSSKSAARELDPLAGAAGRRIWPSHGVEVTADHRRSGTHAVRRAAAPHRGRVFTDEYEPDRLAGCWTPVSERVDPAQLAERRRGGRPRSSTRRLRQWAARIGSSSRGRPSEVGGPTGDTAASARCPSRQRRRSDRASVAASNATKRDARGRRRSSRSVAPRSRRPARAGSRRCPVEIAGKATDRAPTSSATSSDRR